MMVGLRLLSTLVVIHAHVLSGSIFELIVYMLRLCECLLACTDDNRPFHYGPTTASAKV